MLEGSVRVAGDRIRVTAQLIDADSGFHLWAQSYDRNTHDLFAMQDELAGSIARVLEAKLGGGRAHQPDPRAYELFLQARALAWQSMPDTLLRAIEMQEQVIARDPRFARAWGDLAGTLVVAVAFGVLPQDRRTEARARAEQALRLDPGVWLATAALAALDAAAGRWREADAGCRAAVELEPNEPIALQWVIYHLLAPCGHLRRAAELSEEAIRLAPADANMHVNYAVLAMMRGDQHTRDAHYRTAAMLGLPDERIDVRVLRSRIAFEAGRIDEAADQMFAIFQLAAMLMGAGNADFVRLVYAALAGRGDAQQASQAIADFVAATDRDDGLWRLRSIAGLLIHWQVRLGSIDGAFDLADRMVASWRRSGHLAYTNLASLWGSGMRPFRRDERFQELVAQLDMIPFWERHGPPDGYELSGRRLIEIGPPG